MLQSNLGVLEADPHLICVLAHASFQLLVQLPNDSQDSEQWQFWFQLTSVPASQSPVMSEKADDASDVGGGLSGLHVLPSTE